jgi:hypothetical protein
MTPLSVAGLAGYAFAILLALAWVVSIVLWDSYQHGGRWNLPSGQVGWVQFGRKGAAT